MAMLKLCIVMLSLSTVVLVISRGRAHRAKLEFYKLLTRKAMINVSTAMLNVSTTMVIEQRQKIENICCESYK